MKPRIAHLMTIWPRKKALDSSLLDVHSQKAPDGIVICGGPRLLGAGLSRSGSESLF
ncbi:MAG: hypothetical protein HHJ16_11180 [Polaromonas sp.]|uniref:hypothetical protein n=1 Tax=Polaromonas sp. TaxID=1869339 RepID=UPI00180AFFB3|nr:hypothetical protein [Polaromonas sp.]NMM10824.1 hypothetical protein [Polaromonas sp.]